MKTGMTRSVPFEWVGLGGSSQFGGTAARSHSCACMGWRCTPTESRTSGAGDDLFRAERWCELSCLGGLACPVDAQRDLQVAEPEALSGSGARVPAQRQAEAEGLLGTRGRHVKPGAEPAAAPTDRLRSPVPSTPIVGMHLHACPNRC